VIAPRLTLAVTPLATAEGRRDVVALTFDDGPNGTETEALLDLLTELLQVAMRPGELALVHDGGGDRHGSIAAVSTVVRERLAAGWRFVLPRGA